jgi:hypothetical protein
VPLPGVSVTASNSLTGKRYSTTTDITGSYTLVIPQNGRYVLQVPSLLRLPRSPKTRSSTPLPTIRPSTSPSCSPRAPQQQDQQTNLAGVARQLLGTGGSQNLNLLGAASDLIQAGNR